MRLVDLDDAAEVERALMELRRERVVQARARLTPEGVERLAEIFLAGGRPTVGFFRRYRAKVQS